MLADCCSLMGGKCVCALPGGALCKAGALRTQFRTDYDAHVRAHRFSLAESFEE